VGSGAVNLSAFTATVYPVVKARCAGCHSAAISPLFADSNPSRALNALTQNGKVNLDHPDQSRIVERLRRDFHNCWSNCNNNSSDMENAVIQWRALLDAAAAPTTPSTPAPPPSPPGTARKVTVSLLVPSITPQSSGTAAGDFTTMEWSLNNSSDTITPELPNAVFRVDIQEFDAYTFRLRNPRIVTTGTAIYVRDLRVAINGTIYASDNAYTTIAQRVPTGTSGTVLSANPMVMLFDDGRGRDSLALSFELLQAD